MWCAALRRSAIDCHAYQACLVGYSAWSPLSCLVAAAWLLLAQGDEKVLTELRPADFESKAHHDANELRPECRKDYKESHMADKASGSHLGK